MKLKQILLGLGLISMTGLALAEGSLNIVTIDPVAAIMQSSEAKAKMEKLKADLSKEEKDFNSAKDALGKLDERYKKDAAVMSADQKRNLEKQIEDQRIELGFKGKKLQKSAEDAKQELFQQMAPKFEKALKAEVDEKKFDMVLRREAAIYTTPAHDITEEVVKRMNSSK